MNKHLAETWDSFPLDLITPLMVCKTLVDKFGRNKIKKLAQEFLKTSPVKIKKNEVYISSYEKVVDDIEIHFFRLNDGQGTVVISTREHLKQIGVVLTAATEGQNKFKGF